jgi:hypothetical protein
LDNDDKASDQDKGTSKPTSRTLDQVRFHFVGNFQVDLTSWKEDILYYGGLLVFSIEETDVAVVPDHNNKADIQLLKKKGISVVSLTDLHTVLNGDTLLANVIETPSKVMFAEDAMTNNKETRSPPTSTRTERHHRIPMSELKCPPGGASVSSISAAGQSGGSSGGRGFFHQREIPATTVGTAASKFTSILNIKITFPQSEDPKEVSQSAIRGLLRMFQKYDGSTKIRHLTKPNAAISTEADVPPTKSLYGTWAYFNNASPADLQPYQNGQQDKKRSLSFTIIIGSSTPMKSLLESTIWDRDEVVEGGSIHIEIKALQAVKTEQAFVIIATPTFCSEEDLTNVFGMILQQGITMAKKKKPEKYKNIPDSLPSFALKSDFLHGLPWMKDEAADKEKIKPYMKKPLHIVTLIDDYEIWKEILGLVERTDNLKLLFGGGAFIIDNRDYGLGRGNRSEDEIDTLQECNRRHIWASKNTNSIGIRGARKVDTPCRIRKAVTDERGHLCNGKADGYQIDQMMTLREIIMKIKHKGTLMFVLLAKKDGKFIAFHRNTYDEVKDFAKRFESEPAGHIMHWLLRRGIEADDIYNLLRVCFTEEEAAGALETKMENGRVVSQRSLERAKQVMAFDMQNPDVDITQAMRASEIVEYKAKQEAISLREAAFLGRSNIELGERNNFAGGEGTVYTRRNDTLGGTEFEVFDNERWEEEMDEDEEDFKPPVWDEEQLNLVRINMGHLYNQKGDGDNNELGEESKANEDQDEDDNTATNYETTQNQVRDEVGDNTDDPGQGQDVDKPREEKEEPQLMRGGGEEEEIAPGPSASAPSTTKPTIPTLSALIDALQLSKDKLFFISIPTDMNNGREWRLVRLNLVVAIMHIPSCIKTGKDFWCEFYRCHPADLQLKAIDQRYWLQYFTKADLLLPRQIANNHLIMTSKSSDKYAFDHKLQNAGKYINVLQGDTFIHGPFSFATGKNLNTRDRIRQEDWQALAVHSHMFQNPVPDQDSPIYRVQVVNETHIICPGTNQDMFNHMFALPSSDDESLFSEVEDTEIDNGEEVGEEHNSRINDKEAEIKNNICAHTPGGRVEGEGKLGVEQQQNRNVKDARKYEPTEEEGSGLPQSKRMRLDAELDWRNDGYWRDRKQRHQEMKEHYHEMSKSAMTSENNTTVKYPGNQHKEEAGNLGEGAE